MVPDNVFRQPDQRLPARPPLPPTSVPPRPPLPVPYPPSTPKLVRGMVFVFGAIIIIWLNASTHLSCEKAGSGATGMECTLSLWAFNAIPIQDSEVQGVRSVSRREGIDGNGSRGWGGATVAHLILVTDRGTESLGYFGDQFAKDWQALDNAVRQGQRVQLVLERPFAEFVIAHLAALAAIFYGLWQLWQGVALSRGKPGD